jgi:acyl-CoA thioesterase-1
MIHFRRLVAAALVLAACGESEPQRRELAPPAGKDPADGGEPVVLFLGTSLTAGLGVDPDSAYPALVQRRLDSLELGWKVANAGVSGETSAGAARRIGRLLRAPVRVLVVETGANDGLRGLDTDSTAANLRAIVAESRRYDPSMPIVLAGMEVPPNLGARYGERFRALFRDLASRESLILIPFLLEGVGGVDSLNQDDGIHPNEAGHRRVAENAWAALGPVVRRLDVETGR